METRGRNSAAEREIAQLVPVRDDRPEPPADLSAPEAEEWRAVVERMPADWFKREQFRILKAYCQCSCRLQDLESDLAAQSREGDGLDRYDQLAKMAEREIRTVLACATKLRLTHQSRYDEKKAFRETSGAASSKPWNYRPPT